MSDSIDVFFVSNGTGITSETLGLSLLAQFPDHNFNTRTFPFVDSLEKTDFVADEIRQSAKSSYRRPIVICTIQDTEHMEIIQKTPAMWIDPFGDYLPRLEDALAATHHHPDRSHRAANFAVYDSRIEAVEFSIAHDDGGKPANYAEAEIILVGVSRSGKTPSSLYLAIQFGLRAANYPITEEDMDSDRLPKPLREYKNKLYGLTTDPNRLTSIRQIRRPNSRYSSIEQCRFEIRAVENLFKQHDIRYLNTSAMSVEEISAHIIRDTGLKRAALQ